MVQLRGENIRAGVSPTYTQSRHTRPTASADAVLTLRRHQTRKHQTHKHQTHEQPAPQGYRLHVREPYATKRDDAEPFREAIT